MYPTKELRWFFKKDSVFIRKWFEQNHDMAFSKTKSRDDYYLPQQGKKDSGIKLRERKIEVKTLHGKGRKKTITETTSGFLESWTKWSFEVAPSDKLAKQIIDKRKFGWLKTTKARMGFKLVATKGGAAVHDIKQELENGCQVEYTRLKIKNDHWYTFAVESFGTSESGLYEPVLQQIAAGVPLNLKDSMGYPEFLDINYFSVK